MYKAQKTIYKNLCTCCGLTYGIIPVNLESLTINLCNACCQKISGTIWKGKKPRKKSGKG